MKYFFHESLNRGYEAVADSQTIKDYPEGTYLKYTSYGYWHKKVIFKDTPNVWEFVDSNDVPAEVRLQYLLLK